MLFKDIEKLVRLVEKSEIDELEWEKNKERIRIRKTAPEGSTQQLFAAPANYSTELRLPAPAGNAAAAADAPKSVEAPRGKEVLSPFVGTFYAAAAPGAPKYADIGQRVKKGDVLCIIEAMKIMNEIEAEFPGKIISILAKDGQPVQYGQPLYLIEP